MSSERWRRANDLFERAVALPEEEREAFLEASSDGDATLQAAVERWLEADGEAAGFLDEPLVPSPATPPPSAFKAPQELEAPQQLGPYRVLEEIGRGGMGVVYRGIRDDEAFRREVAIKVLSSGGMSPDARRRLDIERRILASLDHPGIARIYDGGTTPSGLPFLVMEYVEGEPIDAYCHRLDLSVPQRVRLFRQVCEAVRASHQNLVVHCDLKPGNILVTDEGRPKLLDFGIAKLLGEGGLGVASDPITRWPRPLTPQYASPEQIRGEAISTVSDVYSLGVLLFKLLTGQRPHILEGLSAAETERHLGAAPERPSTVAAATGSPDSARQIRGDLDAIVLKAMRSETEQRYSSVEQMSADLGRHLDGFSVEARQGNTRYRLGKFLRRHRAAVAVAVLFVGSLSAYALSMASMAGRLAQERDRLQGMNEFTLGIFEVGSPDDETQVPTLVDAVHQNVDLIQRKLQDQPRVLAAVLGTATDIFMRLDKLEEARKRADQALAIHAATDGENSLPYANALVRLGSILTEFGEHEDAEAAIQQGLSQLRQHPEVAPVFLVEALNALVHDYCFRGEHASVDEASAEAWLLAQERLDLWSEEAAAAAVQRGAVLQRRNQLEQAQALYQEGLERYERLQGREHPYRGSLLNNLGRIYLDQEKYALAWQTYQSADAQYVRAFHEGSSYRRRPLVGMATASANLGNHADALLRFRKAVEISLTLEGTPGIANVATYLVDYLLDREDCSAGEDLLRQSLEAGRINAVDSDAFKELEKQIATCGFSPGGEHG
ncbi:MAG: serine/threonine-protein kinase [Deltaproteobacteria bacterium]|nr:serine/threonine-protein kinase [Deltaproteobacteria bacterium]